MNKKISVLDNHEENAGQTVRLNLHFSKNIPFVGGSPHPQKAGTTATSFSQLATEPPVETGWRSGEYVKVIRCLFQNPSVVAIIGTGSKAGVTRVCDAIAMELAASHKRVVIVSVRRLLYMNPITIPDEAAFVPGGKRPNVCLWPSPAGQPAESFKSRWSEVKGNWLDSLRRNFDAVLLDCNVVSAASGFVETAAMADNAVLVVEAGRATKQQIQCDQQALLVRGTKLAGCIMLRRR